MPAVVLLQQRRNELMNERTDGLGYAHAYESGRCFLFFFLQLAGPELVLFITDGLWGADCLAAGWGHNKMMCLPKAAEAGSPGTKWPSYEERRLIGRLESAATSS